MSGSGSGTDWSIGAVIGAAGSAFGSHLVPFGGTALVAGLPSLILSFVSTTPVVQMVVNLIVSQIITVTLVYGTTQVLRGRQVTIGDCLSTGLGHLGAALGVAIVSGLAIGVASLLFLIPGLILYTMWAVAIPAAAIENTSIMNSLRRSSDLTLGRRWRVFGVIVVMIIIVVAAGMIVGGIAGILGQVETALFEVITWIVTTLAQAFSACVMATLYVYLRRDKEGADINQIASVFD